ncbi:MAG: carbohydrate ABC transporter permease [Clostridiales bacterium]|nr:carbohydrate ABC transporter permease [Clostridiales bacterium]
MQIILQVVLILTALAYLYFFVWMVAAALKPQSEFAENAATIFVRVPQWHNFVRVTREVPFFKYVLNTLMLVFGTVAGTVICSSLVAFSFAKLRWPGKRTAFLVLLSTMMVSAQVLQIPTFVLFTKLGWRGTYLPIIVPTFFGAFGGGALNIFLMREYYKGISDELVAAAKIDGCSYFNMWRQIILPLSVSVLVTIAILTFIGAWNDYLTPLLYIDKPAMFPLSLGLRAFKQQYQADWAMMMAGAVLSMLPTLAIYFIFQKHFMEGVSISSGIKG